jgi:ribosomal protein S12 methylthiotransferase accessory factor YcaO
MSTGKGLPGAQAKVPALMEPTEGFHAEEIRLPVVRNTVGSRASWQVVERYPLRSRATKGKT